MAKPRLGFLGVGWIGRHRLQALVESGVAEITAVADADPALAEAALESAPGARRVDDLDALLAQPLDGVVIATPSALHAEQSIRALERGLAVFCQKPLGRNAQEAAKVVEAARNADRLLGVDLSYRGVEALRRVRDLVHAGELGEVFAADLVFHNAYGPDKPWFYDRRLAGGGCVMDLGVHLIDMALWALDFPEVTEVASRCYAKGQPLVFGDPEVEDYAIAQLTLATGAVLRLACSWHVSAGRDAVIEASFFGSQGGAAVRNVNGSFYDFEACHFRGTACERLVEPPDAWGGRAAVAWAAQLAERPGFDDSVERVVDITRVIDEIYFRGMLAPRERPRQAVGE